MATWDHPRVCGEQADAYMDTLIVWGSSPRVRGTVIVILDVLHTVGIIPACAGNRSDKRLCEWLHRDHPRVCGEQVEQVSALGTDMGSSPRVRGTASLEDGVVFRLGIIPACAGNSGNQCKED